MTRVIADASEDVPPGEMGNVLVFVHGYNNDQDIVMKRHRRLRDFFGKEKFPGVVVSFDWPSGDKAEFYRDDLSEEHSWHIGDPVLMQDMLDTMRSIDRAVIPTRELLTTNRFRLVRPA